MPDDLAKLMAEEQRERFDPNRVPGIDPLDGFIDKHIGYVPLDCPNCGRQRVEGWLRTNLATGRQFVVQCRCEKCRMTGDGEYV